MPAATQTTAASVRESVGHPIIDADGHFVEVGPILDDELMAALEEFGGRTLRDRFRRSRVGADRHGLEPGRPRRPVGSGGVAGDAVVVGMADR